MAATPRKKPVIKPVSRAALRKADDEAPVPVYDARGNLVGIVGRKDITPVDGADAPTEKNPASKQPKPTLREDTLAAAGEDPEMGIQKARAAALQVKQGLYGGGIAADKDRLAVEMSAAASRVLKEIQGQAHVRRR